MKMNFWIFAIIIFALCSCSNPDGLDSRLKVIEVTGRNESDASLFRPIIYRMKIPKNWEQLNPPLDISIADTTKAIVEFVITDSDEKIRITIHNFPSTSLEQRIPPMAQLNRWKKQFQSLDQTSLVLKPQAFGGYSGFVLDAKGILHNAQTSILGWILQLAPEHYRALSHVNSQSISSRHKQMQSDITIKAVGPTKIMDKHHEDIFAFARSFQLIDDIP